MVEALFFLVSTLGGLSCGGLLGFGFFHGFLGFFGALGAGFGALLALFVQHLFAAEKFDERLFGAIALLPAATDDAQVAALAVAEARADGLEQLVDGGIRS